VANQIAARLATEFYPKLFPSAEDFQNLTLHVNKSEIKRAEEMIELIRRKSGKKNISSSLTRSASMSLPSPTSSSTWMAWQKTSNKSATARSGSLLPPSRP
jgi:hypothetical protein